MGAREVAAGAAWLDENFPGWEREIDLGILNLNHCENCICGQSLRKYVSEKFANGFDYAMFKGGGDFLAYTWATNHGFYCHHNEWDDTEGLWRDLIKERFSSGNLSDN